MGSWKPSSSTAGSDEGPRLRKLAISRSAANDVLKGGLTGLREKRKPRF